VNNSGDWIVYGDDNSADDDILVYNGNVITRQGVTLAGLTLGTTIDAAVLNNNNEIVQLWDLQAGGEALFWGAASIPLLRTGDELDTTGDGMANWILSDFNVSTTITDPVDFADNGRVFVHVDLTQIGGGTAVDAIISVAVPEPTSFGMAMLCALALALSRKPRQVP
jgi:hypothetical protein